MGNDTSYGRRDNPGCEDASRENRKDAPLRGGDGGPVRNFLGRASLLAQGESEREVASPRGYLAKHRVRAVPGEGNCFLPVTICQEPPVGRSPGSCITILNGYLSGGGTALSDGERGRRTIDPPP